MSKKERFNFKEGVSQNLFMSNFVPIIPFSPDTILKERCLG